MENGYVDLKKNQVSSVTSGNGKSGQVELQIDLAEEIISEVENRYNYPGFSSEG